MNIVWDDWIHTSSPPNVEQQQFLMRAYPEGYFDTLGSEIAANGLTRSTFIRTELTEAKSIRNPKLTSDMVEWILAQECMNSYFNTLEDAFKHQPDDPDVSYLMALWGMCVLGLDVRQQLYSDPVWQRLGLDRISGPPGWRQHGSLDLGWAGEDSELYVRYTERLFTAQFESTRPATTGHHQKRAREPSPPPTLPTESPAKRQRT